MIRLLIAPLWRFMRFYSLALAVSACRYDLFWVQWCLMYLTDGAAPSSHMLPRAPELSRPCIAFNRRTHVSWQTCHQLSKRLHKARARTAIIISFL